MAIAFALLFRRVSDAVIDYPLVDSFTRHDADPNDRVGARAHRCVIGAAGTTDGSSLPPVAAMSSQDSPPAPNLDRVDSRPQALARG